MKKGDKKTGVYFLCGSPNHYANSEKRLLCLKNKIIKKEAIVNVTFANFENNSESNTERITLGGIFCMYADVGNTNTYTCT